MCSMLAIGRGPNSSFSDTRGVNQRHFLKCCVQIVQGQVVIRMDKQKYACSLIVPSSVFARDAE